jgi:ferric-dicitrate binding protein FerR (iron transport regulator)
MDCEQARLHLPDHLVSRPPGQTGREVADHLAACPACREAAEKSREAVEVIATLRSRGAAEELVPAVRAAIENEQHTARPKRKRGARRIADARRVHRRLSWMLFPAVAVAVVLLAVSLFWRRELTSGDGRPSADADVAESPPLPDARARPEVPVAAPLEPDRSPAGPLVAGEAEPTTGDGESVAAATPDRTVDPARLARPNAQETTTRPGPEETGAVTVSEAAAPAAIPEPKEPGAGVSLAFVAATEGEVEYSSAGHERWVRAREGTGLRTGDRVRAGFARARIEFESGSVLYVNRSTHLALAEAKAPPGLSITGGEVYVEAATRDTGFRVETPHGRVVDLGTRFTVAIGVRGSLVAVVEGKVRASTDAGAADLAADQQVVLARRDGPPGTVRRARDLARRLAWTRAVSKPTGETLLLARDGRIVGRNWRPVRDPEAQAGIALEAPRPILLDDGLRAIRKGSASHIVFPIKVEAGKEYHVWVRGKCTAAERRTFHDAIKLEAAGGVLSDARAWGGVPGPMIDELGHRQGYWWVGGVKVRFEKAGPRALRLYAVESPVRIDRIWLSTTQSARPEAGVSGPPGTEPGAEDR